MANLYIGQDVASKRGEKNKQMLIAYIVTKCYPPYLA